MSNPFVSLIRSMGRKYEMDEMDIAKLIWDYGLEHNRFVRQRQMFDNKFTIDQQTLMEEHARFKRMLTRIKGHADIPMHIRRWIAYFTEPGWEEEIKKWTFNERHFGDTYEFLEYFIRIKEGTLTPEIRESMHQEQEARSAYSAQMRGECQRIPQHLGMEGE